MSKWSACNGRPRCGASRLLGTSMLLMQLRCYLPPLDASPPPQDNRSDVCWSVTSYQMGLQCQVLIRHSTPSSMFRIGRLSRFMLLTPALHLQSCTLHCHPRCCASPQVSSLTTVAAIPSQGLTHTAPPTHTSTVAKKAK